MAEKTEVNITYPPKKEKNIIIIAFKKNEFLTFYLILTLIREAFKKKRQKKLKYFNFRGGG